MNQGDYVAAEEYFEITLETLPSDVNLHINLGVLKSLLGKTNEAEHHFRTACRLECSESTSLYAYAKFLVLHKRYDEAEKLLLRSIVVAPEFKNSHVLLLEVYHREQNWEQLSELAKKILRSDPKDSSAKKYLDISANKTSIIALSEDETKKNPTAGNYLKLSQEYYSRNLFAQSFHAVQQALKIKKQFPEAHYLLGLIYKKLGNTQKAKVSFRKAAIHNVNFLPPANPLYKLDSYSLAIHQ